MAKVRGRKSWVGFLRKLKLHDKIEIAADDHSTVQEYCSFNEIKDVTAPTIYQIGYYVNHDKDLVRVAGNMVKDRYATYKYTNIVTIPSITSIKRLR